MGAMGESRAVAADADRRSRVDALQRLYDHEVSGLYGFVMRRCGDVAQAEDIVQDVFVQAAQRVAAGDSPPGRGWLYSTARSRIIDQWRSAARRTRKPRLLTAGDRGHDGDGTEQLVSGAALMDALGELRPRHRAVLVLKYADGLSTAEVASTLDISAKAVESMLARARRAFAGAYPEVGT